MLKSLSEFLNHKSRPSSGSRVQDSFDFLQLINQWEAIVGPQLQKHTYPMKIHNSTLIVLVKHSAYSNQLSFMSEAIKQKIYKKFPSLKPAFKKIYYKAAGDFFNKLEKKENEKKTLEIKNEKILHPFSPQHQELKSRGLDYLKEELPGLGEDEELSELMLSLYIQSQK